MKKTKLIYGIFMAFFMYIIIHSFNTNYKFYVYDSLVAMILVTASLFLYKKLRLNDFAFACIGLGLALHCMGAFGFYAQPPTPWEWDLTTHVFGLFTLAIMLYGIMHHAFGKDRTHNVLLFFVVIFATLGTGVLIEFLEFGGYAIAGFEEGFLGRGPGDLQGDWISGDYWDTMVDMWYNLIGALAGFIAGYFSYRQR